MSLGQALSGTDIYGSGSTAGSQKTVTTLGQILDLYIVHFVIAIIVIIGGIILIERYANYASKPSSAWDDLFYTIGALTLALNVGFCIGLIAAWINRSARALTRQDGGAHWLHALSIFTAAFTAVWGILALILTFGNTLGSDAPDQSEVAGYFMMLFGVVYCGYLVLRYLFNLAGKSDPNAGAGVGVQGATTADGTAAILAALASSRNTGAAAAQPLFAGASGAAAFGGIDLSGLQPSSMSTLPPTQGASPYMGGGCAPQGYPMMMMPPQMMMAPQQMAGCNPDHNVVHLP